MPHNWSTKKEYNGINILLLWMAQAESGFRHSAWLTYKQAQEMGGQVRKNEKGVPCIFYKVIDVDDDGADHEDEKSRKVPIMNRFTLFNIGQIDGLDLPDDQDRKPEYDDAEYARAIERLSDDYCQRSGVKIDTDGSNPMYIPSIDTIKMPFSFSSAQAYAGTLAHEMIHSTGISSRLDRFSQQREDFGGKKKAYAFEELVAEIGATFVCARLGLESDYEDHADYVAHWLERLKDDKSFIFKAAAAADRASRFIDPVFESDLSQEG